VSEADLSLRIAGPVARPDRPASVAIAAAVLLHLFIAWLLIFGWREDAAPEPRTIEVTLLALPPPTPPPAPPPEQKQQVPFAERESGPGEQTTAAPRAAEPSPQTEAPPPPPAPPSETQKPAETAPSEAGLEPPPAEKPTPPETPRAEPKPKLALHAPEVAPPLDRAIGEKDETGDPYLNAINERIQRNRAATTPVGSEGLHLEGYVVYRMVLDPVGRLVQLTLVSSSGSDLLDNEARRMIVAAAPFPSPPPDYPSPMPAIIVQLHLYPQ
jgi:TonB family protein